MKLKSVKISDLYPGYASATTKQSRIIIHSPNLSIIKNATRTVHVELIRDLKGLIATEFPFRQNSTYDEVMV